MIHSNGLEILWENVNWLSETNSKFQVCKWRGKCINWLIEVQAKCKVGKWRKKQRESWLIEISSKCKVSKWRGKPIYWSIELCSKCEMCDWRGKERAKRVIEWRSLGKSEMLDAWWKRRWERMNFYMLRLIILEWVKVSVSKIMRNIINILYYLLFYYYDVNKWHTWQK